MNVVSIPAIRDIYTYIQIYTHTLIYVYVYVYIYTFNSCLFYISNLFIYIVKVSMQHFILVSFD